MTQRTEVPKFGNWESEDEVPYTTYFDNARKGNSGAQMSPDAPEANTDTLLNEKQSSKVPISQKEEGNLPAIKTGTNLSSQQRHGVVRSANKSESESPKDPDASRPRHERRPSHGEGDLKKSNDSSLRHESESRKAVNSAHHGHGGISTDSPRRVSRQNVGSDRSVEQSPLHPNHQTRLGNKNSGVSSPSWERKSTLDSSHGLPSTPGRSRLRSVTRGDDTPDDSPAVPKFGDWDESDPTSGEGYTQVFDRVREEKQSGTGKVPIMPTESSYSNGQKQYGNDSPKGCLCFPWGKK
ncbi:RPM1-interacting protein 4-like [Daucus carota subsp. sativus]|uniref:RPM1-interacting protein 4-like n=1 Tax=Daucus carota subsp. sativus TaxID=79200 RepID=UPI0007EFC81A|nr:PREDICTED: RPM1-interacting protein 4-like [Daucus carota subsp. sativus]